MADMRRETIHVTLRPDTIAAVRALAEKEGSSVSRVLERVAREATAAEPPQPEGATR
jgi:hypothetical protein